MIKRHPVAAGLSAGVLPTGELEIVVAEWKRRLAAADVTYPAKELYGGRNFALARDASRLTGSPLWVVSAGLGMVSVEDRVPAYSATVAGRKADSVLKKLPGSPTAGSWWRALAGAGSLARMIAASAASPVLLALPGSYLKMVESDLLGLSDVALQQLRIFTRSPQGRFDPRLQRLVLPYDVRLDGPDSPIRGTLSDFAARALRDFCSHVLSEFPGGSLAEHRLAVERRVATWQVPPARRALPRQRDDQILALIRLNWERTEGRTSELIRLFRDDLQVPCEARRMRRLAETVRGEAG